jgi:hypothetical protein
LAASSQDRRARLEAELKLQEEERARATKRLELFVDQANILVGNVAALANSKPEEWGGATMTHRDSLRLQAAQMLGKGHLLDTELAESVRKFIASALEVSNAPSVAQARKSSQRCGADFEILMQSIGDKLRSVRAAATHVNTRA